MQKFLLFFLIWNTVMIFSIDKERPIFFTSMGKSGTHLLAKCLKLITKKNPTLNMGGFIKNDIVDYTSIKNSSGNYFFHQHQYYSNGAIEMIEKCNFVTFFLMRDPRDVIVSSMHWVFKHKDSKLPIGDIYRKFRTSNEILKFFIERSTILSYKRFWGWLSHPNVCTIRYENLVGTKGGGNSKSQRDEIIKICNHLKMKLSDKQISYVCQNAFGDKVGTFRKGQIGSWKTHFTNEHKELFKKVWGNLLIDLGYEKDMNW
ncbi:MAG: sulfotransferase domain-containing protein [Candidatus Babeliales bacterium]|nr:sulfotransferase domain-containing protein [Candidatus Babeliales bacterium]